MKVESDNEFNPVELKITLESQEEVDQFHALFDHVAICQALSRIDHVAIRNALSESDDTRAFDALNRVVRG